MVTPKRHFPSPACLEILIDVFSVWRTIWFHLLLRRSGRFNSGINWLGARHHSTVFLSYCSVWRSRCLLFTYLYHCVHCTGCVALLRITVHKSENNLVRIWLPNLVTKQDTNYLLKIFTTIRSTLRANFRK